MPIVLNATNEEVSVKVAGNWFSFKPGTKKNMNESIARFIQIDRKDSGLCVLPLEFEEDADFEKSAEGKAILEQLKADTIRQYLDKYKAVIYNNQVSLRQDLEQKNLKIDPAVMATEGEINALKIVAKYKVLEKDADQVKLEEVKKLLEETKKGK
jgi:hypothetical protein